MYHNHDEEPSKIERMPSSSTLSSSSDGFHPEDSSRLVILVRLAGTRSGDGSWRGRASRVDLFLLVLVGGCWRRHTKVVGEEGGERREKSPTRGEGRRWWMGDGGGREKSDSEGESTTARSYERANQIAKGVGRDLPIPLNLSVS